MQLCTIMTEEELASSLSVLSKKEPVKALTYRSGLLRPACHTTCQKLLPYIKYLGTSKVDPVIYCRNIMHVNYQLSIEYFKQSYVAKRLLNDCRHS